MEYALKTRSLEFLGPKASAYLVRHGRGRGVRSQHESIFAEDYTWRLFHREETVVVSSEMFEKENWKRLCMFQQSMAGFSAWELNKKEEEEEQQNRHLFEESEELEGEASGFVLERVEQSNRTASR